MNVISVCGICKEPVGNFFCLDCLSASIREWLPPNFCYDFDSFQETIQGIFYSRESVTESGFSCKDCDSSGAALCLHCYINEVVSWLREYDTKLAREFTGYFSMYDMAWEGSLLNHDHGDVLAFEEDLVSEGMCEGCDAYSDWLVSSDGLNLCERCRWDEIKEKGKEMHNLRL